MAHNQRVKTYNNGESPGNTNTLNKSILGENYPSYYWPDVGSESNVANYVISEKLNSPNIERIEVYIILN